MAAEMNLNDLVVKEGEEFNESKETIKSAEDADIILNNLISTGPIPGQTTKMPTSDDVTLDKKDAENDMIVKLATEKLQKEVAEFKKKSDEEKIRDYIYDTEFHRYTNDFFRKNGFEMSGSQRRDLKRTIDRAWKKGKYKLTPEQKQDILFELNKASNEKQDAADQALGKERIDNLGALSHIL